MAAAAEAAHGGAGRARKITARGLRDIAQSIGLHLGLDDFLHASLRCGSDLLGLGLGLGFSLALGQRRRGGLRRAGGRILLHRLFFLLALLLQLALAFGESVV